MFAPQNKLEITLTKEKERRKRKKEEEERRRREKSNGCTRKFYNLYFAEKKRPFDGSGLVDGNVQKSCQTHICNPIRICNGLLVEISKRWSRSCPPEVTE